MENSRNGRWRIALLLLPPWIDFFFRSGFSCRRGEATVSPEMAAPNRSSPSSGPQLPCAVVELLKVECRKM